MIRRNFLVALALVGSLFAAGSAFANDTGPRVSLITAGQATYVVTGDKVMIFTKEGAKECKDCTMAVMQYAKTGKIEAKCAACGAERVVTPGRLANPH
jgi:hypothetical protein